MKASPATRSNGSSRTAAARSSSRTARSRSTTRRRPKRSRWPRAGSARSRPRRPRLSGRRVARRLADRQCRVHAQLALRLFARQRRRFGRQGQVRRGPAAEGLGRRRPLGGDARRLEPRGLEILRRTPEAAIALALWLASTEQQKVRALKSSHLPTIVALYDDADIAKEQPIIPRWKEVFLNAVPRPSAPTKEKYNEVSKRVLDRRAQDPVGRRLRRGQSRRARDQPDQAEGRVPGKVPIGGAGG